MPQGIVECAVEVGMKKWEMNKEEMQLAKEIAVPATLTTVRTALAAVVRGVRT